MPFDIHTIETPDSSPIAGGDTVHGAVSTGLQNSDKAIIANYVGVNSGASGSTSSVNVVFTNPGLPPNYSVQATAYGAYVCSVTKGTGTFTVTMTALSGDVAANAELDVLVLG